ncbi:MAG: 50S ribosomal protein L11 methyltransferase [Burkholderiales bacterium]|nr:50S ribosomal protein L11 methyltransferase [Burkholderiales bacterium]
MSTPVAWTTLSLELEPSAAERLSARLIELGAPCVSAEDPDAGTDSERPAFDEPGEAALRWRRVRLQVLVEDAVAGTALLARACAEERIEPRATCAAPIETRDWVRASQAQFQPMRAGERIWVVPSWCEPPDPSAFNLRIDPGLAFGTGSHPSTRLCLRWLEREVRGGETLVDYGCGSGILAIAARKLGAGRALGIDIDPQALESARANAAANGVGCEFLEATEPLDLRADLVVANILANPLRLLAPALAGLTRPGGRLALAGLLETQAEELARIYAPWFFSIQRTDEEGWTLLDCGPRRAT